jgi:hypothetical protein
MIIRGFVIRQRRGLRIVTLKYQPLCKRWRPLSYVQSKIKSQKIYFQKVDPMPGRYDVGDSTYEVIIPVEKAKANPLTDSPSRKSVEKFLLKPNRPSTIRY